MPKRAGKPCRYPGCPEIVRGVPYCAAHAAKVSREYEETRPSSAARGYGGPWRKLRGMVLNRHPLCADPEGLHIGGPVVVATEVDHIVPLARGGTNAWRNLQPLCKSCHSRKTARETWHNE